MTTTWVTVDRNGEATQISLDGDDSVLVLAGTRIVSTAYGALFASGTGNSVLVAGSLVGSQYGAVISGSFDQDNGSSLEIASTGFLHGGRGVWYFGGGSISNAGEIRGAQSGIELILEGQATQRITNRGLISAQGTGLICNMNGGTEGQSQATLVTVNEGTIEGGYWGYLSIDFVSDHLRNSGVIVGNVGLGDGNDRYDGRGGCVRGNVGGDGGDDTFLPGMAEETLNGGWGTDTLDFRGVAGAVVSLLDGTGTGPAAEDNYIGFENLRGSRDYADSFGGDNGANRLEGLGGADTLLGAGGHDTLLGGRGRDRLDGGAGNHVLEFVTAAEGGDLVTVFRNALDNNDAIRVSAAGFGGGLAAGLPFAATQFRSRADNLAQDADDRFVFRTTDKTLWFDIDGAGGAGPIMLLDLDAGTVTAADILVF